MPSPRLWPYSQSNSPGQRLTHSAIVTSDDVIDVVNSDSLDPSHICVSNDDMLAILRTYKCQGLDMDVWLANHQQPLLADRRCVVLAGEFSNPYRLVDVGLGIVPIFSVRLEGICRTWADSLDAREANPGVHHVTLARSAGWWEGTHIGMLTPEQFRTMMQWLDNGQRGTWRPAKLGEGLIRLSLNEDEPPSKTDIDWDGEEEIVKLSIPLGTGPQLPLREIIVPLHAKVGCYNHRGRIARCVHYPQREFHENLFRRGSSFPYDAIIHIQ